MNRSAGQPKRLRWPLTTAITLPPILIGGLVAAAIILGDGSENNDLWVGGTDYGPTSAAPPSEVQAIHAALHEIGTQCLEAAPDVGAIRSDIDLITGFAERYPIGRFPIDDETATAASLLIVIREAVEDCAPAEVGRIDALLNASPAG